MNELFIVLTVVVVGLISYKLGEYMSEKKNKPNRTTWKDPKGSGQDGIGRDKENLKK